MHNVEKWPNILLKPRGVNTASFLKYVWPFLNIKPQRVNYSIPNLNFFFSSSEIVICFISVLSDFSFISTAVSVKMAAYLKYCIQIVLKIPCKIRKI